MQMKMSTVRLQLLGPIQFDGEPLTAPRKARALLAYVAAHRSPLQRDHLAGLFCGEAVDPRRTLRTLLSHIRRVAPAVLATDQERVSVQEHAAIDCHRFSQAIEEQNASAQIMELYRGQFVAGEELPGVPEYELWLLGRRSYYKYLYEKGLLALAQANLQDGVHQKAREYGLRLVESNPYLEDGHTILVQVLVASGQLDEARARYEQFSDLLRQEWGLEATVTFEQLVDRLAQGQLPGKRRAREPQPRSRRELLLSDAGRLKQWLGPQPQRATLQRLRRWAHETVQAGMALAAYHDVAAALDTASVVAEWLQAPAGERAVLRLQRALLGEYVDDTPGTQAEAIAQAETLLGSGADGPQRSWLKLARANLLYREGRYQQATQLADEAARRFRAEREWRLAGRALTVKGRSELRSSQNRAAIASLREARRLLMQAGDEEGQAVCLGQTAWAHLNLGQTEQAFEQIERALQMPSPALSPLAVGHLYYARAACWNYYYDAAELERCARLAIERYEQAGNRVMANRCRIYLVQADRYRMRTQAARQQLGDIFQRGQSYHDTWLMAWVMALMALSAFKAGQLEEAARWYRRTYDLRRETGERQNQVYDLAWSGRLAAARGNLDRALRYTESAVRQMEQEAGDYFVWEAWDVYLAHAEVLQQKGQQPQAMAALEAGYHSLQRFVERIRSAALQQQVLQFENSRHLVAAWESEQITPFHRREHRLI